MHIQYQETMGIKTMKLTAFLIIISSVAQPTYFSSIESAKLMLQQSKVWSDGNIGVIVKGIQQESVLSDSIIKEFYSFYNKPPVPKEGYEFVSIRLIIEHISDVHLVSFWWKGEEKSNLSDTNGNNYKLYSFNAKGIEFLDIHDIRSPSEYVVGAICILIFEVPKECIPAHLDFIYYFKDELKKGVEKKVGKIEIRNL